MLDTHCHLADPAFADDLDAVIERARRAGVEAALCVLAAGSEAERDQARRVSSLWPEVRYAVGVHPHQAGDFAGRVVDVETCVRRAFDANPHARAVGEIGLDYHYDFAPRELQQDVFRRQVTVARDLNRPVVVHMRESEDDTLAILEAAGGGRVRGILHCFASTAAVARRGLEAGFHLSFSGIVTFKRADALRRVAADVPVDRLLVETDAPYLAPVPHRGRRNEPAWVAHVVEAVASVRGTTPAELTTTVRENFVDLVRP